jgi:hypothetical protein
MRRRGKERDTMMKPIRNAKIDAFLGAAKHFSPVRNPQGFVTIFTVERCEKCGGEIVGSNAIGVKASDKLLTAHGLTPREIPFHEGFATDDGGECCSREGCRE